MNTCKNHHWALPSLFLCISSLSWASPGAGAGGGDYQYDDGESNTAIGNPAGGDMCAIHRFDAFGGLDTIVQIDVAYGTPQAFPPTPPPGTPVTLCVWEDPSDSGDPLDAVLLTTMVVTLENPNTDILNPYVILPTIVEGSFWVGFFLTQEQTEYPAAFDGSVPSNGRAWLAADFTSGGFNPFDLGDNDFPPTDMDQVVPGVFLLRTHGAGGEGTPYCFGNGQGTPCPCGNNSPPSESAGCLNSTGRSATAFGFGSNSVAADDFQISARRLLPFQPALLFVGDDALNGGDGIPFGDGLRCAGNHVVRLGVKVPNAQGIATWGPGLRLVGGWGSGDVRRFQVWYRDPTGSPCESHFNLTNGIEETFAP